MNTFKDEVLNLIEEMEIRIQEMREDGETDLRSVIYQIRDLYTNVSRLEEDGEYLND